MTSYAEIISSELDAPLFAMFNAFGSSIMNVVKILVFLVIAALVAFFVMGLMSQRGKEIGLADARLAPCSSKPNCVSSEIGTAEEKMVAPLKASLEQVKAAITSTGGIITREQPYYISATYTSSIFRFVDDVEIRDSQDGLIHIRSASRVGYSDRGVNKKRVEAIHAAIK